MVVFDDGHLVGEAEGHGQLYLVLRLVRPVPALSLGLPEHRLGEGVLSGQLGDIVQNAVFILEIGGGKFVGGGLLPEAEGDPGVDHRLALEHVGVVVHRDADVGEHLQVGLPADGGAGLFAPVGGLLFQPAHVFPLLKVERIVEAVPPHIHVHIRAGILGGAGAQAVQAQGVLVVVPAAAVLAAGVQLAEHQLPVVLLFVLVPVHRTAPSLVLHLDGLVQKAGDGNQAAVALPGLVNGVGQNLKDGVLAALQPVGAKDDTRALAHPVGPLQGGDGVVAVACFSWCHKFACLTYRVLYQDNDTHSLLKSQETSLSFANAV